MDKNGATFASGPISKTPVPRILPFLGGRDRDVLVDVQIVPSFFLSLAALFHAARAP